MTDDIRPNDGPPRNGLLRTVYPPVFWPALVVLAAAALLGIVVPEKFESVLLDAKDAVVAYFGWYFVLVVAGFVVFAIWMGLSRFGDIKLGPDEEDPEYGLLPWFAMLFAAGMGIGLVFYGVAEPVTYFGDGDRKASMEGEGVDLAQSVLSQTFVHWGFHAWAIYVVVGLAIAYAVHRKGRPISIRWALEPLLGERVRGRAGDLIDVLAVVGTVAGVATSLGLGVKQISAGLAYLGVFEDADDTLMISLIVVITLLATLSVASGVGRGIKWLSNANLTLAGIFLLTVLALGPTMFLLRTWVQQFGVYLGDVLPLTFNNSAWTWGATPEGGVSGGDWQGFWTIFYWGWWISWAPFVGVFIARISRGRTVRQFVAGVLLVPTMVTFLWFSVLGGSGLHQEIFGTGGILSRVDGVATLNYDLALFQMLEELPASGLLSGIVIVLVSIFFITSSDSGSLVVDMLASGGDPEPPTWSRILWATLEGALAAGLLLAGGLTALQTGAILTALPFSVVMVAMCFATYRALSREHWVLVRAERRQRRDELERLVAGDLTGNFEEHFGKPVEQQVRKYVDRVLARRRAR